MQEVIAVCAFCGNELYEGDEVLLIDGGIDVYVCDEVCLVDYLLKTRDVKKVVLKDEGPGW
jgi:alpha-D-ribose 1-methylphosphonate 5-phosphate C-P lyase